MEARVPHLLDFLAFQISHHSFSQQLITRFTGLSCSKQYELGLNDKARKKNRGIRWDGASNFRKDLIDKETFKELSENEICSVVSDSLRPHRLYSPWNSPGWNTGVGKPFSSPRGSSQPRDRTQVSCIEGRFFYQLSHKGSPRILEWVAYPFSRGSSQPRNQTGVSCIASGFFTN